MMMAAVRVAVAGVGHAHVAQPKAAPEPAFDGKAVLRPNEIENGVLRRGLALSGGREWKASERSCKNDAPHGFHDRPLRRSLGGKCDADRDGGVSHVGLRASSAIYPDIVRV